MKSTQSSESDSQATAPAGRSFAVAGGLLAEFEAELATTRKFLERVPAGKLDWRPHEKSMTVGQLALHVAQVPLGVLGMATRDEAPPPNFAKGREQPRTAGEVLEALDRSAAFLRSIMLNHWYHHRGQLGVYLRLLGASVPASYGPSGDESPFG